LLVVLNVIGVVNPVNCRSSVLLVKMELLEVGASLKRMTGSVIVGMLIGLLEKDVMNVKDLDLGQKRTDREGEEASMSVKQLNIRKKIIMMMMERCMMILED